MRSLGTTIWLLCAILVGLPSTLQAFDEHDLAFYDGFYKVETNHSCRDADGRAFTRKVVEKARVEHFDVCTGNLSVAADDGVFNAGADVNDADGCFFTEYSNDTYSIDYENFLANSFGTLAVGFPDRDTKLLDGVRVQAVPAGYRSSAFDTCVSVQQGVLHYEAPKSQKPTPKRRGRYDRRRRGSYQPPPPEPKDPREGAKLWGWANTWCNPRFTIAVVAFNDTSGGPSPSDQGPGSDDAFSCDTKWEAHWLEPLPNSPD